MNSPIQVLYVLFLLSSRIPGTKEGGEGFLRLRNIQKPNRISKLDYSCPGEVGICMYFICLYPLYALWFFTSDFLALILTFKIFILLKFAFSINKFFWMKPFDWTYSGKAHCMLWGWSVGQRSAYIHEWILVYDAGLWRSSYEIIQVSHSTQESPKLKNRLFSSVKGLLSMGASDISSLAYTFHPVPEKPSIPGKLPMEKSLATLNGDLSAGISDSGP